MWYNRAMPSGIYQRKRKSVKARFMAMVNNHGPLSDRVLGRCWLWEAAKDRQGYGFFWYNGRQVGAHRWAYEQEYGPIPDGLQIDHLCRMPSCVRPTHMEPVTLAENLRRGLHRNQNTDKTHCIRGHLLRGANLYVNPIGRRHCRTCDRARYMAHVS